MSKIKHCISLLTPIGFEMTDKIGEVIISLKLPYRLVAGDKIDVDYLFYSGKLVEHGGRQVEGIDRVARVFKSQFEDWSAISFVVEETTITKGGLIRVFAFAEKYDCI